MTCALTAAETAPGRLEFIRDLKPILEHHCFGCHADGANEGSLSFDELLTIDDRESSNEKWHRVLRQLNAGLMPPLDEEQPDRKHVSIVKDWIKYDAFGLDPINPDPGRVTVRRLNQVEYRNTFGT